MKKQNKKKKNISKGHTTNILPHLPLHGHTFHSFQYLFTLYENKSHINSKRGNCVGTYFEVATGSKTNLHHPCSRRGEAQLQAPWHLSKSQQQQRKPKPTHQQEDDLSTKKSSRKDVHES